MTPREPTATVSKRVEPPPLRSGLLAGCSRLPHCAALAGEAKR